MQLLQELKRRKVYRVGIAYLAASWVALQLADVVLENLELPGWAFKALLAIIVIGFPVALALAWAFELTPDGLRRDAAPDESQAPPPANAGQYIQLAITAMLAIAVGVLVVDKFRSEADAPGTPVAAVERSVVVLPFENLSAKDEDVFFVDGMHDYLLTQLHSLQSLEKVIARRTALTYRDTRKPLVDIAAELGVATVLTGGFQRAGDNVRINMQLIRADTGKSLWANSWDRRLTLENVLATQADIALEVVEALQGALTQQDRDQLAKRPTDIPEAWESYTAGRSSLARRTIAGLRAALEDFERAVELDPDFVLAWVGVADAYSLLSNYDETGVDPSAPERRRAIDRALALDPTSGEALTALAELRSDQGDDVAAAEYFQQAIIQAPHYPTARHWYALLLAEEGRVDQAISQIRTARSLDQKAAILAVAEAGILIDAGDYEAAERTVNEGIADNPDFRNLYTFKAQLLSLKGRFDESLRWQDEAVRLDPSSFGARISQCAMQSDLALTDMAQACLDAVMNDFPDQLFPGLSVVDLVIDVQRGAINDYLVPIEALEGAPEDAQLGMALAYYLAEEIDGAEALVNAVRPDLFASPPNPIAPEDITNALLAAGILEARGELQRAREVLDAVGETLAESPSDIPGAKFTPIIRALGRGDYEGATAAMHAARESGQLQAWWIFLTPIFEQDMQNVGFAAAFADLTDEITRQRESYLANPDIAPL